LIEVKRLDIGHDPYFELAVISPRRDREDDAIVVAFRAALGEGGMAGKRLSSEGPLKNLHPDVDLKIRDSSNPAAARSSKPGDPR
jgi:hypothetical protein